ncbi:hypothetical protein Maes01_01918 [Microbulbifer aestuariivivens]|uniref:Helix-hairpin-helix domain-containing protein n=1 Tax=Microbulbifer aestuariivivens TaxID=1908308 RepID=A0ABP9WQ62_9GAMM
MKTIRLPLIAIIAALFLVLSAAGASAEDVSVKDVQISTVTVNVNSASAEELAEKLVGIGAVRAKEIVEYRQEFGPFTSIEQLLEVKGVGTATLDKNRARIQL